MKIKSIRYHKYPRLHLCLDGLPPCIHKKYSPSRLCRPILCIPSVANASAYHKGLRRGPDFPLLERKTIIEAMGLKRDWYWKRNKRKIKDYLHNKYIVIAVVPNGQIYETAKRHLSKRVKVLPYREFEDFVARSLEKVPSKQRFSSTGKNNAESRSKLKSSLFSNLSMLLDREGRKIISRRTTVDRSARL
nr:hypothetical protein [Candidatus Njordarchaeota archaeon]